MKRITIDYHDATTKALLLGSYTRAVRVPEVGEIVGLRTGRHRVVSVRSVSREEAYYEVMVRREDA